MPNRVRVSLRSFMLLACLVIVGCGNPTVNCEVFVNDTLLLEGIINFTPKELARGSVLGNVKNGKVLIMDDIRLQAGQCDIVLTTTKEAILGDENFTPTFKASAGKIVVLEKKAFDVPDGSFELRFTSGVKSE